MAKLHRQNDPWSGIILPGGPTRIQGWNSGHPWLQEAIAEIRPRIVVEIGVWKGGSVAQMALKMAELGLDSVVIAVDTWLGSSEHWTSEEWSKDLPWLYHTFLENIGNAGLKGFVVPLRLDSLNAARLLRLLEIRPNLIHLDAGHDYRSLISDLSVWWPLLEPGGLYLGDDYHTVGGNWPEVKQATDDFFYGWEIESTNGKCRVRKSGVDEPIQQP